MDRLSVRIYIVQRQLDLAVLVDFYKLVAASSVFRGNTQSYGIRPVGTRDLGLLGYLTVFVDRYVLGIAYDNLAFGVHVGRVNSLIADGIGIARRKCTGIVGILDHFDRTRRAVDILNSLDRGKRTVFILA